MARALSSLWAEVDEARLVRVEGESIPSEALAKDRQHPFGVIDVVERVLTVSASSANRTTTHSPLRRGFTTVSNHSSNTWCRKTFERQGEITPPCGEPSVVRLRRPPSTAPAFSHLSIIRRITPSVTRWSRNARRWKCGIESKYLRMSMSSTQ